MEKIKRFSFSKKNISQDYIYEFYNNESIYFILFDAYDKTDISEIEYYAKKLERVIKFENFDNLCNIMGYRQDYYIKSSICLLQYNVDCIRFLSFGDCRIYVSGSLKTKDDSCFWRKQESLGIDPLHIANYACENPFRGKLINKLSPDLKKSVSPIITNCTIKHGDIISMCTDGFWEKLHKNIINNDLEIDRINSDIFTDDASAIFIVG